MKKILVLGAGRSSANLIKYMIDHASQEQWLVRVGDLELSNAEQKLAGSSYGQPFQLNAGDQQQLHTEISTADLVISMLPASMHPVVAKICLELSKHLITPSYASDEMLALHEQVKQKGLLFLNEMGVDPGIDHMSAMKIIHHLQQQGAEMESFESFTGGLIAPESDNNPWNYKITWNPRNVVLAGAGGTACYFQHNSLKYIPYHRLFQRLTPVSVEGYGDFEGYANRDSLKYKSIYGLEQIPTIYRGTLRRSGFCKAWDALVQLGLTDDSFQIENPDQLTWRQLTASFLDMNNASSIEDALKQYLQLDDVVMHKLKWLGIFDNEPLHITTGSPAIALQQLIEQKWKLDDNDKDMIVMWHRFYYTINQQRFELQSSLIALGDDPVYTAMSKTVGLPMAIAAHLILTGKMNLTGVLLPVIPEIYLPLLDALEKWDIRFVEQTRKLSS